MPRALTPSVLALLRRPQAEFVHLIEAEFSGGTLRFTTGALDLLWNAQTWTAVGGRLELGQVDEAADLRNQGTELVLSAVDLGIVATLLTNDYRGRPVVLRRAYVWQEDNLVPNALDLSAWTNNSPGLGLAGSIDDPYGGRDAWRLTDDQATSELASTDVTIANSTRPRGLGAWFRYAGDGVVMQVELRDVTAGATRGALRVDFSDPDAPVAAGALGGELAEFGQGPAGWWHVSGVTGAVTVPTNAHRLRVLLSTVAAQGSWDVHAPTLLDHPRPPRVFSPTAGVVARAGRVAPDPIPLGTYLQLEPYEVEERRTRDGGAAVVRTRLASRLAAFAFARGIRANPTSHGHHYAGDTGFSTTFGLAHRKIYWGTEAPVEVGGGGGGGDTTDNDTGAGKRPPFQP